MCGIVGFVNKVSNKERILNDMLLSIHHRGPDGTNTYIDANIALGHNRLAIIDLENGDMPQFNEDQSLAIIFNGEIYNYQEMRKNLIKLGHVFKTQSDTEVIIHAYEEWKLDTPKHLRGMFAFAIWDKVRGELILARDEAGIKPLYYTIYNNTFIFASEIKAILKYPNYKKVLNEDILASYLCMGFTPTCETFFKGIYNLEPGSILVYKNKEIFKYKYFKYHFDTKKVSKKDLKRTLEDSIKYHQISDVPIGSFLSSGVDSSYIVASSMINKTYTVGYENNKFSETTYAINLSKTLGIENKNHIITKEEYIKAVSEVIKALDEPLADPSAIAVYFLARLASKDLKVVMSGEGADELFGGYLSYLEDNKTNYYRKIPFCIRHILSNMVSCLPDIRGLNFIYRHGRKLEMEYLGINRICRDKEALNITRLNKQLLPSDITKQYYQDYENCTDLQKKQMIDFNLILSKDFLRAIDANCMLFGLEARTPFLDKEVYKISAYLKDDDKVSKNDTKVLFRRIAKDIIPTSAYKKKKLGFPVPLKVWMKEDDLYKEIQEKYKSTTAKTFFNQKKILKLLHKYKNNKYDNYKLLWSIYIFIVWYDIYFN